MFRLLKHSSFFFSFDGSAKQLLRMISDHLSSESHRFRCYENFVMSVSKAAAIRFVFDVLDMLKFTFGAERN
jgi:hypothetical protein